jgi:MFS family permease
MRKPSLLVIFLTVFIDLVGFGIVLPLLPIYSRDFGAGGWLIGTIMASYSAMQFLFAPVWGRWSDRIGRRPVLLISLVGSTISYCIFAIGSSYAATSGNTALVIVLISRIFAGICGANITVAQAYIADITPPDQRSKGMGMIGMAFGLGFIFGPALGSLSHTLFGITGPGWVAACFCLTSFVVALTVLPESWKPSAQAAPSRPRLEQWKQTFRHPALALLILVFFLATFGFTCFETTLGLLIGANFGLDAHNSEDAKYIGLLFAYCGVIGALIQGGAIGRLVKKYGEPKLITTSQILFAISMGPLPFIRGSGFLPWFLLLFFLALLAAGSSMTRPPVFGMISMLAGQEEQGAVIGVAQSAGSLARIVGPIFAGVTFVVHPAAVYLTCAVVGLFTGGLAWLNLSRGRQEREVVEEKGVAG